MNYPGEHLIPGNVGHLFLVFSLVASLGATLCYFLSVHTGRSRTGPYNELQNPVSAQWKRLARIFFIAEVISVLTVFALLFHIISHHYFEYKYAWQHSSKTLETKYLLSCFWEGQEGSFLLWSVWHCVLGLIFIFREKEWEAPVMTVVSFAQVLLATMIIGVSVFGHQLGSNPFVLMRTSGLLDNAPALHDPETGLLSSGYVAALYSRDGNDLNVLLQNYWMVIHPPVLFLGFASTVIPFSFAIAGLWTRKFSQWTKAALPWALFSAGVLGLGIMMGAAWAYESLNFGGYWAWDPVENASLVPWLVLVAGVHALLIYRHTGNALRTTYWFFILTFALVLYSTYLTRSGDLQDTSVHAFTGEGITVWHLRAFFIVFALPSAFLMISRYKQIPFIVKEEATSSREFWMFIGSLVLFLAALMIISMTSIPVINKLITWFTGKEKYINPLAVGEDSAYSYNRIQVFVAVILAAFTGCGMYLKYKQTGGPFLKKLLLPVLVGVLLGAAIIYFGNINYSEKGAGYMFAVWLAVVAAVFSAVGNASYIVSGLKGNIKKAGGAIAHTGFALMLVGILISSSKKEVLSYNTTGINILFGKDSKEKPGENLTLVKGLRTDMGKYWVTYDRDSTDPVKTDKWFYHLQFEAKDGKESFALTPNAFINHKGNMGLSANPDAKHHLTYDIFTYITSLPNPDKSDVDTTAVKSIPVAVGDTFFYSKGFAILQQLQTVKNIPGINFGPNDSATVAVLKVQAKTNSIYTIKPILINKGGEIFAQADTLMPEGLMLQLQKVNGNKAQIGMKESDNILQYVTLKAYKFPFINLLWLGTIIMVFGFFISMLHRRSQRTTKKEFEKNKERIQQPAANRLRV